MVDLANLAAETLARDEVNQVLGFFETRKEYNFNKRFTA